MRAWTDALYEVMVMVWIVASPLAIAEWVKGMDEPVTWAAFIAGVLGVLVGWIVVAPYELARKKAASAPET